MKKVCMILFAFAMIMSPAFAGEPSAEEVAEAFQGVTVIFSITMMGAMFGAPPAEGVVQADMDMQAGDTIIAYKNLDVEKYLGGNSNMTAMMGEDMPDIQFSSMSGKIVVDSEGNMVMDVDLTGGSVKTLFVKTQGEEMVTFDANGKDYVSIFSHPAYLEMME